MKMNLQKFAGKTTNVFPVSANQFKLGADKESATTVADLETFSPSFAIAVCIEEYCCAISFMGRVKFFVYCKNA